MSDNNLPKIRPLKLGNETIDLDHWLKADYPDIAEASEVLPGILEFISSELQGITERKLNTKQAYKRRAAEVFMSLRNPSDWDASGYQGKATDKALELAIDLDEEREKFIHEYNKLVAWEKRLINMLDNFQVKLDLVRTVEATKRKVPFDGPAERPSERQMRPMRSRREIEDDTDNDNSNDED